MILNLSRKVLDTRVYWGIDGIVMDIGVEKLFECWDSAAAQEAVW